MTKRFAAFFALLFALHFSTAAHAGDLRVVWAGSDQRPRVALTFDDGPSSGRTDKVLDLLRDAGARATFFVLGSRVESGGKKTRELLQRMRDEGHEIGNHTWSHLDVTKSSIEKVRSEIERTQNVIESGTGVRPRLFRPPGGGINFPRLRDVAGTEMEAVVMWSIDPADWMHRARYRTWNHIADRVTNGSIILLHDIHAETISALPLLIDLLQARGYELVTISELLEM